MVIACSQLLLAITSAFFGNLITLTKTSYLLAVSSQLIHVWLAITSAHICSYHKFMCGVSFFLLLMQWSWQTILMGFCFLVFLLVARHVVRLITPPLFVFKSHMESAIFIAQKDALNRLTMEPITHSKTNPPLISLWTVSIIYIHYFLTSGPRCYILPTRKPNVDDLTLFWPAWITCVMYFHGLGGHSFSK